MFAGVGPWTDLMYWQRLGTIRYWLYDRLGVVGPAGGERTAYMLTRLPGNDSQLHANLYTRFRWIGFSLMRGLISKSHMHVKSCDIFCACVCVCVGGGGLSRFIAVHTLERSSAKDVLLFGWLLPVTHIWREDIWIAPRRRTHGGCRWAHLERL